MVKCNRLETDIDIQDYKKWLQSKPTHFLKHLLITFTYPPEYRVFDYPKLELRIGLVQDEINSRIN